jgi:CBS-domain-containing membrane protein
LLLGCGLATAGVTLGLTDSVADLLPRLTECAERRVLVFSNGHLTGIITPSDSI